MHMKRSHPSENEASDAENCESAAKETRESTKKQPTKKQHATSSLPSQYSCVAETCARVYSSENKMLSHFTKKHKDEKTLRADLQMWHFLVLQEDDWQPPSTEPEGEDDLETSSSSEDEDDSEDFPPPKRPRGRPPKFSKWSAEAKSNEPAFYK